MAIVMKNNGAVLFAGLVLSSQVSPVMTHYHDGDSVCDGVAVLVWDREKRAPKRHEFAELRPHDWHEHIEVTADATPDVIAELRAYEVRDTVRRASEEQERREAATLAFLDRPHDGFLVRALRGRKVKPGTVGLVVGIVENTIGNRTTMRALLALSTEVAEKVITDRAGKERKVLSYVNKELTSTSNLEVIGRNSLPAALWAATAWKLGYDPDLAVEWLQSGGQDSEQVWKAIDAMARVRVPRSGDAYVEYIDPVVDPNARETNTGNTRAKAIANIVELVEQHLPKSFKAE